jgi:aerobic carbon-monoxide dehydrogenase large subunit
MAAPAPPSSAVNDALAPFGVIAERQPLSPMAIRALLRGKELPTARK